MWATPTRWVYKLISYWLAIFTLSPSTSKLCYGKKMGDSASIANYSDSCSTFCHLSYFFLRISESCLSKKSDYWSSYNRKFNSPSHPWNRRYNWIVSENFGMKTQFCSPSSCSSWCSPLVAKTCFWGYSSSNYLSLSKAKSTNYFWYASILKVVPH